jgi:uroporphyrinogen-III synthase
VVAVHGPVTAEGGARLGIEVDIVGDKFQSFGGVVDSLARHFAVRT